MAKAVEWCREQNLEFDAVNDNLPEIIEFYGHNSQKTVNVKSLALTSNGVYAIL